MASTVVLLLQLLLVSLASATTYTNENVESFLTCDSNQMIIEIRKSTVPDLDVSKLKLKGMAESGCQIQSNSTFIYSVVQYDECGTVQTNDDRKVIFTNEISSSVALATGDFNREDSLTLTLVCKFTRDNEVQQDFDSNRYDLSTSKEQDGSATFSFDFYTEDFARKYRNDEYPLTVYLGETMYMEITLDTAVTDTKMYVYECKAGPSDTDLKYTIFVDGCGSDDTFSITSESNTNLRFTVEGFEFYDSTDVYLDCSVKLCKTTDDSADCKRDCGGAKRRKRAAVNGTNTQVTSKGPLHLRKTPVTARAIANNLNMNLVFIAGCVLAMVGMVSGALLYRGRVAADKHNLLPTFES